MTTHREENVDSAEALTAIFEGVRLLRDLFSQRVVFAVHPRTRQRIEQFGLGASIASIDGLTVVPALGYLSFLSLLAHAALVLTDSGGVQQEACLLQIPCLTLRNSTEWIETVSIGANVLVGTAPDAMLKGAQQMLAAPTKWDNPFGDRAAPRIVDTVAGVLGRITGNAPAGADAEAVGA
jgi:UDP-N-acetylglucosamine 2-epimerase (non-hydrolysing)